MYLYDFCLKAHAGCGSRSISPDPWDFDCSAYCNNGVFTFSILDVTIFYIVIYLSGSRDFCFFESKTSQGLILIGFGLGIVTEDLL